MVINQVFITRSNKLSDFIVIVSLVFINQVFIIRSNKLSDFIVIVSLGHWNNIEYADEPNVEPNWRNPVYRWKNRKIINGPV